MTRKVVPMFHVPDVPKTVEWYKGIGFDVTVTYDDGGEGLSFAMMSFGSGEVMFSSGGQLSTRLRREVDLYVYTDGVDALFERIKDRVDIVEGPHNMFYGMREVIVRDVNGFWVTFGQEISIDDVAPWPRVDADAVRSYLGTYKSDDGLGVKIVHHEGRLLAVPQESPAAYLRPAGGDTFIPATSDDASVAFAVHDGAARELTYTQGHMTKRFRRTG